MSKDYLGQTCIKLSLTILLSVFSPYAYNFYMRHLSTLKSKQNQAPIKYKMWTS